MSESPPVPKPNPRYLVVRLAEHTLALPIAQVVEVCRVPLLAPGKGEAPGLLGLAVLRGTPTAVFDLGELLGFASEPVAAEREPQTEARLVTVRMAQDNPAAFLVDEVIGLREIPAESVHSIALPGDRIQRIGEFDQEFARLIDSAGLVPQETFQQLAEAAE